MFAMKKANCAHQKITAKFVQNAKTAQAAASPLCESEAAMPQGGHSADANKKNACAKPKDPAKRRRFCARKSGLWLSRQSAWAYS
jgi:hypothetical protein